MTHHTDQEPLAFRDSLLGDRLLKTGRQLVSLALLFLCALAGALVAVGVKDRHVTAAYGAFTALVVAAALLAVGVTLRRALKGHRDSFYNVESCDGDALRW